MARILLDNFSSFCLSNLALKIFMLFDIFCKHVTVFMSSAIDADHQIDIMNSYINF